MCKKAVTTPVTQEAPKETAQKAAPVEQKAEEPVMAKAEPKKVETVQVKEVTEAKSSQFGNILFDFDKYTVRGRCKANPEGCSRLADKK